METNLNSSLFSKLSTTEQESLCGGDGYKKYDDKDKYDDKYKYDDKEDKYKFEFEYKYDFKKSEKKYP